ncbi:unnamed protein product, partial [Linum tenue]
MAAGVLLWVVGPKENAVSSSALLGLIPRAGTGGGVASQLGTRPRGAGAGATSQRPRIASSMNSNSGVSAVYSSSAAVAASPARSSEEKVYEVVLKQAALVKELQRRSAEEEAVAGTISNWDLLNDAYDRCGVVCAEYAK